MRKLFAFNHITLEGYFAAPGGDISFFRSRFQDDEFHSFAVENIRAADALLFGRLTYEIMLAFWPTPDALKNEPAIAACMNSLPKYVFSRSLSSSTWNNTHFLKAGLVSEVHKLKDAPGKRITILGSGNLVAQLAPHGLIDEYEIILNPVAIGAGRTLFDRIPHLLNFRLTSTRVFRNGNVLLCYSPAA